MKTHHWLISILLFSISLNVYAAWSQPLGMVVGTANFGYNLQIIYDGNPNTWTQLQESSGLTADRYFGVRFNSTQILNGVRFRNDTTPWNSISQYSILVLPPGKNENIESD